MPPTSAILAVQAAVFALAALVHAGVLVSGYEHREAMIAETVIAIVLALGLVASLVFRRATRPIALGVQAFALLGTFVGLFTIAIGVGPRTLLDLTIHSVMVALLITGLVVVFRRRAYPAGS